MTLILETRFYALQNSTTLDEHDVVTIYQNVGYRLILKQGLKWPKAKKLIQYVRHKTFSLILVQGMLLQSKLFVNKFTNFRLNLRPCHFFQGGQVDKINEPSMQFNLQIDIIKRVIVHIICDVRTDPFLRLPFVIFANLPHDLYLHTKTRKKCCDIAYDLALCADLLDQHTLVMRCTHQRMIVVDTQFDRMP